MALPTFTAWTLRSNWLIDHSLFWHVCLEQNNRPAFILLTMLFHPRRPRGSQPGRERRRDESFQVRVKEPLGTDSHRTISKIQADAGPWLGTKNALYYCAQSANSFSRVFSWVRTRQLLSRHTCPFRSPSLCVRGKLLFSSFLTRNEGTTDMARVFCLWLITMYRK